MAVFRCKRSGNTITLTLQADIEGVRKHEGYEEIKDGLQEEIKAPAEEMIAPAHVPVIKRGRQKKVV